MRVFLLVFAMLLLTGGCAPQPGPAGAPTLTASGPRQCFNSNNVTGFRVVDPRTVDLDVGVNRTFRAELFGTCPDVGGSSRVALLGRGGSSFVCDDQDLELVVPTESRQDARRCPVRSLRQLTEAEIAAARGR